ncbi:putative bifunctional diguanylate cyclase/phosphodiesterase [Aliikangiella sp. IMCC44653]
MQLSYALSSLLRLQTPQQKVAFIKEFLFYLVLVSIFAVINSYIFHDSRFFLEYGVLVLLFIGLYFFVSKDTSSLVTIITMWTITIFCSYIAWHLNGIHATILFAYPCILIFSVMLSGWGPSIAILAYLVASLLLFVNVEVKGLVSSYDSSQESIWGKFNNIIILLAMYVVSMYLVTRLFAQIMTSLKAQSQKYRQLEETARRDLEIDFTTQLPSLIKAKSEFKQLFSQLDNTSKLALICLDINNFKVINSTLGSDIGDIVLKSIGQALSQLTLENTRLYRGSGSEFVLLKISNEYALLEEFSKQILQSIQQPISTQDFDIDPEISVGVAVAPFDGNDFESLHKKSRSALIQSRKTNSEFCFYETEMELSIKRKLSLIKEIKIGIDKQEFQLYYQPIIDLTSNSVVAAEALIRWHRRDGSMVFPDEFIAIAEESGLINSLGQWIVKQACMDARKWSEQGLKNIAVAVNLSPVQFRKGNLNKTVTTALSTSGLAPEMLYLEITESLFFDEIEFAQSQINSLVKLGCEFAIDDFGAGYSNLNYLDLFQASKLKIDRSFITELASNQSQKHIVQAIINMSQSLGLANIAEGVEDNNCAHLLKSMGCKLAQGYYWSKPVPVKDFVKFTLNQNNQSR